MREMLPYLLPFLAWMVLLSLLPATAGAYAIRTVVTAALLGWACVRLRPKGRFSGAAFAWGAGIGVLVFVLWVLPETLITVVPGAHEASPYNPANCGWTLTIIKLLGSAFVIAPVEELFYRSFLYRWIQDAKRWAWLPVTHFNWTAFIWVVCLFALGHPTRIPQALMAGVFYGWLAVKKGIGAAILAHILTNLLLGLFVFYTDMWLFW